MFVFHCPLCEGNRLVEQRTGTVVTVAIADINSNGDLIYDTDAMTEAPETSIYCEDCGYVLEFDDGTPVTNGVELQEWFDQHADPTQVIAMLGVAVGD
jgi:uncharacterized protein YbaR (Trm112 family)